MANARRANIPLYRQTDPKYFPDYEFREYPKMMKDEDGDPILTNPVYQFTTPRDPEAVPKQVMREVVRNGEKVLKPIAVAGDPVVVNNKDEEAAFMHQHPELAKIVQVPVNQTELLAADNERMKEVLAENARLKAQLEKPARGKPGPKPKAKLAVVPEPDTSLPPDLR